MPPSYQLKFALPFVVLAVRCDESFVFSVDYLPGRARALPPQNLLAKECARQFAAYLRQPRRHRFDLPLLPAKMPYQRRVRRLMQKVDGGRTVTYGEVAQRLGNSSPRAVGGACRANALPLIVPCHRVVAANGLGGFMGAGGKDKLLVKKRLLQLEGAA